MIEKWMRAAFPYLQIAYDSSPYPVRYLMTTLRGIILARMRYQTFFWKYLNTLRQRERLSMDEMASFQNEQLARLIHHSADTVPYYRTLFRQKGLSAADIKTVEDLPKLPVLKRDTVQTHWKQMMSSKVSKRNTIRVFTSGTSGAGLPVVYDEAALVKNWAFMARRKIWVGVHPRQWRITLFGSRVVPTDRNRPPFWTFNLFEKQILMSIFHLSDAHKQHYLKFLQSHTHLMLEGFPTVLSTLADFILQNKITIPMKAVFTDGEPLLGFIREKIESAFATKVYDQYGMTEWAGLIQACEHGRHHLISDYGILEILDDNDQPCSVGQEGNMVWTGFINPTMPFIRYKIGDKGMFAAGGACPCGRPFPLVSPTITREGDYLVAPDGRILSPRAVNQVLKNKTAFKACQFIQKTSHSIVIRIVPLNDGAVQQGQDVRKALIRILGRSVTIAIENARQPVKYASGKTPLIISRLQKPVPVQNDGG